MTVIGPLKQTVNIFTAIGATTALRTSEKLENTCFNQPIVTKVFKKAGGVFKQRNVDEKTAVFINRTLCPTTLASLVLRKIEEQSTALGQVAGHYLDSGVNTVAHLLPSAEPAIQLVGKILNILL